MRGQLLPVDRYPQLWSHTVFHLRQREREKEKTLALRHGHLWRDLSAGSGVGWQKRGDKGKCLAPFKLIPLPKKHQSTDVHLHPSFREGPFPRAASTHIMLTPSPDTHIHPPPPPSPFTNRKTVLWGQRRDLASCEVSCSPLMAPIEMYPLGVYICHRYAHTLD